MDISQPMTNRLKAQYPKADAHLFSICHLLQTRGLLLFAGGLGEAQLRNEWAAILKVICIQESFPSQELHVLNRKVTLSDVKDDSQLKQMIMNRMCNLNSLWFKYVYVYIYD